MHDLMIFCFGGGFAIGAINVIEGLRMRRASRSALARLTKAQGRVR